MKKIFCILGAALVMAVSCNKEGSLGNFATTSVPPTQDDRVLVSFDVTYPVTSVETRAAMGNATEPTKLYIAVFSEDNGYLQNWIPATLTKNTAQSGMDVTYTYKAYFPVTTNEIFHFIGDPVNENPTFDYEQNFVRHMVTDMETAGKEGAFWQRVKVEGGIKAKKDDAGNYILDGTNYIVDDEDANFEPMKHVVLVRNFAKIEVTSIDPNFDVVSCALVNVPKRGTIAPWNAKSSGDGTIGFDVPYTELKDYLPVTSGGTGKYKLGTFYETLTNINEVTGAYQGYSGTLPGLEDGETSYFDDSEPTKFEEVDANGVANLFMYERPLPSLLTEPVQPSTRVLTQIRWKLPSDTSSEEYTKIQKIITAGGGTNQWYMIELLDNEGEYMPILRHICYHLSLSGLEEAGYSTSTAAFNGDVYGNVSSSLETSTLNEITVGDTRIWVNSLDFTYTEAETHNEQINFLYQVNVATYYETTGSANPESAVVIKIVSKPAEINGEPLESALTEEINATGFANGVIPIKVAAASEEGKIKRSIIRVQGSYGNNRAIYREVVVTVLPKQEFTADTQVYTTAAGNSTLASDTSDQDVTVRIGLPANLGSSMFPLQVRIEAEQNSLSATTSDLPVQDAVSTFTTDESSVVGGHRNFYYIRTISYDEYHVLNSDTGAYTYTAYFDCKFKTTKSSGNATRIKLSDARDPQRWHDTILVLK